MWLLKPTFGFYLHLTFPYANAGFWKLTGNFTQISNPQCGFWNPHLRFKTHIYVLKKPAFGFWKVNVGSQNPHLRNPHLRNPDLRNVHWCTERLNVGTVQNTHVGFKRQIWVLKGKYGFWNTYVGFQIWVLKHKYGFWKVNTGFEIQIWVLEPNVNMVFEK